jgi:hypothetical protein
MISEAKANISCEFVKAYRVEMTVTEGDVTQRRTIEASHRGACPAGVAPGDLVDESGKKVGNISR